MSADGLKVSAFDGPIDQGGVFNELARPFALLGLKPDIWAIDRSGRLAAVGEAKTAKDVCNSHTVAQLKLFGHLRQRKSAKFCRLYIAVPHSATRALDRVLVAARLAGAAHVRRMHIPNAMLQACGNARR